jgi:hypothetical protein
MPDELLAIAGLLFLSIAIQAVTLTAARRTLQRHAGWLRARRSFGAELLLIYGVIVIVISMHVGQACVWALFFWKAVGLDGWRDAFYQSILSLTTMDDGSSVLPHRWRLLGAAEGLTGWIVFSWSTGSIFMFLTALHERDDAVVKR